MKNKFLKKIPMLMFMGVIVSSLSSISCGDDEQLIEFLNSPTRENIINRVADIHPNGMIAGKSMDDADGIEWLENDNRQYLCTNHNDIAFPNSDLEADGIEIIYTTSSEIEDWFTDASGRTGFAIDYSVDVFPDSVLDPVYLRLRCELASDAENNDSILVMINDQDQDNITDYFEYLHAAVLIHNSGTQLINDELLATQSSSQTLKVPVAQVLSGTKGMDFQNEESDSDPDLDSTTTLVEIELASNILVASSDGTFTELDSQTTPSLPDDLASVDVDGDGDLDIALVGFGDDQVAIYKNDGSGGFDTRTNVTVGDAPWGITALDLGNDGDFDLVTANYSSDNVTVLTNDGTGGFTTTSVTVGDGPAQVAAADFNEDGNMDLAVANFGNSSDGTTISILTSDSSGVLTVARTLTTGEGPNHLVAADFDADQNMDIAVTNRGFNGDGTTVSIHLGNGDGTFDDAATLTTNAGPAGIVAADFDGDRILDLAVANNRRDDGTTVQIYLGDGDGTFADPTSLAANSGPYDLLAFDRDGDNDVDLFVADAAGKIVVFENDASAAFTEVSEISHGSATYEHFMTVGDFDADGDLDFAASEFAGGTFKVYKNE